MASYMYPAAEEKGGFFRRKACNKSSTHSVFDAQSDGDALDALASGPLVQRQGSKRWGILARGQPDGAATPATTTCADEQAHELAAARAECTRQGAELQALRHELGAAQATAAAMQQQLNLQRFKYELLVDLWAMRVLDNEELGSRLEQQR